MKTLKWTQNRIDEIVETNKTKRLDKKEKNALSREIRQLQIVKMYLETNPREEFVKSEIDRLKKSIRILNNGFGEWLNNNPKERLLKNPESKYRKEVGLTDMNRHLKALKFILS